MFIYGPYNWRGQSFWPKVSFGVWAFWHKKIGQAYSPVGALRVAVPEYSFDGRLEGVLVLALSASSCQELVPILLGLGHLVISLPVPGESSFQHPSVTVQPTVQLQNTKWTTTVPSYSNENLSFKWELQLGIHCHFCPCCLLYCCHPFLPSFLWVNKMEDQRRL